MIHLFLKSGSPCLVGSKSRREKLKKPFKVTKITPHKEGTEGRWTATLGRRRVGAKEIRMVQTKKLLLQFPGKAKAGFRWTASEKNRSP